MVSYEYWHLITKSNHKDYPEGKAIGITRKYQRKELTVMDRQGNITTPCELRYLGRTPMYMPDRDKVNFVRGLLGLGPLKKGGR